MSIIEVVDTTEFVPELNHAADSSDGEDVAGKTLTALDAVDLAKNQFGINLDWSDASIENVEKVLVKMRVSYVATTPRPTPEQVMSFAKGFGSYVGEVYRRNHGAEWGMVSLDGQKFPGLRTKTGVNFWPWGRVSNRITDGDENNVLDYYRLLLKK